VRMDGIGHVGGMDTRETPPALIIVAGPQASGKSTLATALSVELRDQGERVALVELDQIAAMALPTLPSWEAAHHIFEATIGLWARTDLTCVVAEGAGSDDEVSRLRTQAPPGAVIVTVATTVALETAIARAQSDPTRGISKDQSFLSRIYRDWTGELTRINPDIVIDTDQCTVQESVERIGVTLGAARLRHD